MKFPRGDKFTYINEDQPVLKQNFNKLGYIRNSNNQEAQREEYDQVYAVRSWLLSKNLSDPFTIL